MFLTLLASVGFYCLTSKFCPCSHQFHKPLEQKACWESSPPSHLSLFPSDNNINTRLSHQREVWRMTINTGAVRVSEGSRLEVHRWTAAVMDDITFLRCSVYLPFTASTEELTVLISDKLSFISENATFAVSSFSDVTSFCFSLFDFWDFTD